jgi:hypothetical protein
MKRFFSKGLRFPGLKPGDPVEVQWQDVNSDDGVNIQAQIAALADYPDTRTLGYVAFQDEHHLITLAEQVDNSDDNASVWTFPVCLIRHVTKLKRGRTIRPRKEE